MVHVVRVLSSLKFMEICTTGLNFELYTEWKSFCSRDSAARKPLRRFACFIGPIPWGHSGPLCHALSLSSLSWTSMLRRRATVPLATSGELAWGEWANIFQMLLLLKYTVQQWQIWCSTLYCVQLVRSWTRQMDYNYFDRCPIVGNHPYHGNMMLASGSAGHGAHFAPAVGRCLNELIIDGDFMTIDLSRLTFDRVLDDEPITERLVIWPH